MKKQLERSIFHLQYEQNFSKIYQFLSSLIILDIFLSLVDMSETDVDAFIRLDASLILIHFLIKLFSLDLLVYDFVSKLNL